MQKKEEKIDLEKRYYLNPAYIIKPDKTKAIITNSKGYDTDAYRKNDDAESSFTAILNPVYAFIFTLFDGSKKLSEVIKDISNELEIENDRAEKMVTPYIYNEERQIICFSKINQIEETLLKCSSFSIPRFFIIECNSEPRVDLYPKETFYIPKELWNFDVFRLSSPSTLTLMVNNTCATECSYCYANKNYKVEMPLSTEKIISLIEEADKIGVLSFEFAGGEILLHKDYDIILSELYKHGFITNISIKMCLSEEQIIKLKKIGIHKIQVSVDAWDSNILQKILHVNNTYFENLKQSLKLLEKHDMEVIVKSVITNMNDTIEGIERLLKGLLQYKNIKIISIAPGEYSLYKNFANYKTSAKVWKRICKYVEKFGEKYNNCDISHQGYNSKDEIIDTVQNKAANFRSRSLCSGNLSSLYILPDGKVTICEELYWHPKFIVGDVNIQSIQEIWDSKEATELFYLSQKDFDNNSACKHCLDFNSCRLRAGVCWKMILQAYGMDAWQLPDPRCPLAPPPINEFYR
jgi:radical SAM protein with 4Fe4S-binding SPASM domain